MLKNALVSAVALILTLGAAEVALQWLKKPSRLYSSIRTLPAANQWKNEVRFWERHQAGKLRTGGHDPLLGWDAERDGDRVRGDRPLPLQPRGTRIVAIGDSFTYGNEVSEHENFAALLDADTDLEVLNMGVPGYGIDQAYLKYRLFGAQYQPHVILFGIYVDDYERASVGFSSSAKPRFAVTAQGLTVVGQPVPTPEQELARIGEELASRILVVDAFRNLWLKASTGASQQAAYFADTDELVTLILGELQDSLAAHQRLLVLQIPRAESFVDGDPFRESMSARLLAIYERLDLAYIDLTAAFLEGASANEIFDTYYVHRDGGSVGHLSAHGHRRVAELVRNALASPG